MTREEQRRGVGGEVLCHCGKPAEADSEYCEYHSTACVCGSHLHRSYEYHFSSGGFGDVCPYDCD